VVTEGDITEDTTGYSMVVFAEAPFTTEHQDSELDSLRVTGRTVTTIPIHTTVCAKDGFQLVANTWKADKIQIPTFGIRFRCPTGIGKMSPAISPTFSPAKSFPFRIPSRSDLWPRCYGSPSRALIQYRGRMGYPDWTASTAQARCFRDSISASYSH